MKKISLRLRLIIFFVLISCIVWGGAAFLSWKETKEKVDEFFDTYQLVLGRILAAADWQSITPDTQRITNKIIKGIHNADDDDDAIGFAVFNRHGQMIFHDNENGKLFRFSKSTGMFDNENYDGDMWRVVRLPSADKKYTIAVGQEIEYRTDIVSDMAEEFMLPWLIGLILLLGLTTALITVEFNPLKKLAAQIRTKKADDLSPIGIEKLPAEILPLIDAMNKLLQQIDATLKRERSFISDSAHELRTPLTALKVQLEIIQMSEDDPQTKAAAIHKLGQGIERSARLVEQLLAFSKIESSLSQSDIGKEDINWQNIAEQIISEYAAEAAQQGINLTADISEDVPVRKGNPVLCALLLRNLVDNAVKYSPRNAAVSIKIRHKKLEVTNSGTILAADILSRLSERFFRPAGQKQPGSGLGLAIVERIAEFHNCRLLFENTPAGFRVSVLPV